MFDLTVFALFVVSALAVSVVLRQRRRSFPPGPKGLPIIGNLKDMTLTGLWFPAQKWAQQFGEFFFLCRVDILYATSEL